MENKNLVSQKYWDQAYEKLDFYKPGIIDPIRRLINRYIERTENKNVVEIGCFPGRYLSVFGDLGYYLNGIDLTPRIKELPLWLESQGYKVGDFLCDDFLNFKADRQYDIVCSFGFVEHFVNFDEVIKKHLDLVAQNGKIIITTPNFKGFIQNKLHLFFDRKNFEKHYIPSMDPFVWKNILEDSGFDILYCGWWGGFDFWSDNSGGFFSKIIGFILNKLGKILRFFPINSQFFSPYSVAVARRKKSY